MVGGGISSLRESFLRRTGNGESCLNTNYSTFSRETQKGGDT